MVSYYDEIEIEDMAWDEEKAVFHYPCPCGDRFEISRQQLANYEDIARCPSCTLIIRVVFDPLDYQDEPPDDEGESSNEEDEDDEDDDDDDDEEHNEEVKEEKFEVAMEKLFISEQPQLVAVSA